MHNKSNAMRESGLLWSGDQNVFWDAPLKLSLLSMMGHQVMHAVHTSDRFSRPPGEPQSQYALLTPEAYLQDGNVTRWTATLEGAYFLGRMPIHPKEFTERGVKFESIAWLHDQSVQKVVQRFTEGDWIGISLPENNRVAHGIVMREVVAQFIALRKLLRKNLDESVDDPYRKEALRSFDRLFVHPGITETDTWAHVSVEVLKKELEASGVSGVSLTTTVDAFNAHTGGVVSSKLFPHFVKHYREGLRAYNEAAKGKGEYISPLKEGELPFYAVVRAACGGRLERVPLSVERGDDVSRILQRAETRYGTVLAVAGKALAHLIDLRMRGPIVLPQGGSPYVPKAIHFGMLFEEISRQSLDMHPIFWLHMHALDALEDVKERFRLPEYLRSPFGVSTDDGMIRGADFAAAWRDVADAASADADALGGDSGKLMHTLKKSGLLSEETTRLFQGVDDRYSVFVREYQRCMEKYKSGVPAVKAERAAFFAARTAELSDVERKFDVETLKHIRKAHHAALEEKRAEALREKISIAKSLPYWNNRPFAYWVNAIPGWYEAIRKRAELVSAPEVVV